MRSRLLRIEGNLNSNRYIREVLEPEELPIFQPTPHSIFQQDNARPHVVKIVQAFFNERRANRVQSPGGSPDFRMWESAARWPRWEESRLITTTPWLQVLARGRVGRKEVGSSALGVADSSCSHSYKSLQEAARVGKRSDQALLGDSRRASTATTKQITLFCVYCTRLSAGSASLLCNALESGTYRSPLRFMHSASPADPRVRASSSSCLPFVHGGAARLLFPIALVFNFTGGFREKENKLRNKTLELRLMYETKTYSQEKSVALEGNHVTLLALYTPTDNPTPYYRAARLTFSQQRKPPLRDEERGHGGMIYASQTTGRTSVLASTPTREDISENQKEDDVPPAIVRLQTSLRRHTRWERTVHRLQNDIISVSRALGSKPHAGLHFFLSIGRDVRNEREKYSQMHHVLACAYVKICTNWSSDHTFTLSAYLWWHFPGLCATLPPRGRQSTAAPRLPTVLGTITLRKRVYEIWYRVIWPGQPLQLLLSAGELDDPFETLRMTCSLRGPTFFAGSSSSGDEVALCNTDIPVLAPSDFHLLGPSKKHLGNRRPTTNTAVMKCFQGLDADFSYDHIDTLLTNMAKGILDPSRDQRLDWAIGVQEIKAVCQFAERVLSRPLLTSQRVLSAVPTQRTECMRETSLTPWRAGFYSWWGCFQIFACGNRDGRYRWLGGFLEYLPFHPLFHSGVAPYSPHFTLIGSQDLGVKSRPNPFTTLDHDASNGPSTLKAVHDKTIWRADVRRVGAGVVSYCRSVEHTASSLAKQRSTWR
ncbi:hypothetical protein PR048_009474 [Dryococelus australis]|uniref:Uncharacterized protein n=1 Tax=Dryococelus australis TaxID=614101 RepID=A0ABQ9I041_9NEOP|nr:hypothetical protein PR048_009474 [Dryococelus australis]